MENHHLESPEINKSHEANEAIFQEGFDPSQIPELLGETNFSKMNERLARLFSGTSQRQELKLYILSQLINDRHKSSWNIHELNQQFHFIQEPVRKSLLLQLRDAKVLELDYHDNQYKLSNFAYKVFSFIQSLREHEEDDAIGLLTMQVLQSELLQKDPIKALKPLLNKLHQHIYQFKEAIRLKSERLIQENLNEFQETMRIHELASDAIARIKDHAGASISRELHFLTQQIGEAQAELSQFSIKLERSLHQIRRQQVNLQDLGLAMEDLQIWMKHQTLDSLAKMSSACTARTLRPIFIIDQFIDEAQYELFEVDRTVMDEQIVAHEKSDQEPLAEEDMKECRELIADIMEIETQSELSMIVQSHSWEEASFRLSMLSLLQGKDANIYEDNLADAMIIFRTLPYKISKLSSEKQINDFWAVEQDLYPEQALEKTPLKQLSKAHIEKEN